MNYSNSVFTALPKFEDLCCIRCIFTKHQMIDEIFANVKHCQVICCRDIIKNFPKVIASPIPNTQNYAYVVMSKDFYQTNKLQQYLDFTLIGYTSPQRVTTKILKLCLKYTIIYKLMPNWNKCYEYLSVGQNFRESEDDLDAVKLELNVNEEEMILKISPLKIKVHPLKLKAVESEEMHRKEIAYILPSFHKCKILEVKKNIPKSSQFKNYGIIRDHWKNMYGIKLPRSSINVNYCLVKSSNVENPIFFCPDICLQSSLPTLIKRIYEPEIKNRFFNDLKEKVTQICGKEVSFNYYNSGSHANSVEPVEVLKTPNKSLVKNPCFNSNTSNTKTFNYDPKNLKSLLFQVNVASPTKSLSSYSSSFSFQNTIQSKNSPKPEVSGTYSRNDFVKNWLLNSCNSQVSSLDADSSNSKEEFEKFKDSPIESKPAAAKDLKKPSVRSIESVNIPLSKIKRSRKNEFNVNYNEKIVEI